MPPAAAVAGEAALATPYRRRPRSSPKGTWSPDLVVRAIRDWTDTFGEPPRSFEWSPAAGRRVHAARRWANEYPRWPSASTVCLIFGTWNDALRAAGVRVHREMQPSRDLAARVAEARSLSAGGMRTGEIAATIGVSPQTVRRYLRAGSCRGCGEPVVGDAPCCAACAARLHRRPRWSREEVVLAMRAWQASTGQAPRQGDWTPHASRWAAEYPRWPSATSVRTVFGSWSEALRAAGFEPKRRRWDADSVLAALRAWAEAHGHAPTKADLDAGDPALPTSATVRRYLGNLNLSGAAGSAAGG